MIYDLKAKIADACQRHGLDMDADQIVVIGSSHDTTGYSIRGWHPINRPAEEAILLVEDDAMLSSDIRHRLEIHGFKVIEAASYEEALRALSSLEELSFPVAILDLGIPTIEDGISVLKHLIRRSPDTKVIVLTRYDDDEVKGLAVRSGASPSRYILKNQWETADMLNYLVDTVKELHNNWMSGLKWLYRDVEVTLSRTDRKRCTVNREPLKDLTKNEHQLLLAFADNGGRMKRDDFLKSKTKDSFDSALRRLRRKLANATGIDVKEVILLEETSGVYSMPHIQLRVST